MMRRTLVLFGGLTLLVGACGDDDDGADEAYCDLVAELAATDEQPSDELLDRYVDAAPDEIDDEAELAAEAIKERGEAAFDDPDVVAAIEDIEAFEAEECGIEDDTDDLGDDGDEADDTTDGTSDDTTEDTLEGGEDDGTTTSTTSTTLADEMTTVTT
jgi:hypothetical protein